MTRQGNFVCSCMSGEMDGLFFENECFTLTHYCEEVSYCVHSSTAVHYNVDHGC